MVTPRLQDTGHSPAAAPSLKGLPGGSITAQSGPFHLPAFPNETVQVSVE
ncbi:MAG TPA: hypothetical protein PKD98_09500 [Anaerolineae bacterium]|nr:hypothetical protein [Anaerolineae bacterium]